MAKKWFNLYSIGKVSTMRDNKLGSTPRGPFHLHGICDRFGNGLHPVSMTLSKVIDEEIVLVLIDDTDFIDTISNTTPFNFYFKSLVVSTSGGPVAVFVFYVSMNKYSRPIYIHDISFNPTITQNYQPWLDISKQTHVHLLLVNKFEMTVNLFEFVNNFEFDVAVEVIQKATIGKFVYWDIASTEYNSKFSPIDVFLYETGLS